MPIVAKRLSLSSVVNPLYETFLPLFTCLICKIGHFNLIGKVKFLLFKLIFYSFPYLYLLSNEQRRN